ncbi:hypothetical protein [Vulcanisaeta distributa]|nr:hypothetical protein [Vulcanisaeta distributa]
MIRQLLGEYGVYSSRLKLLYERALELLGNFNAELEWVPREENARLMS